MAHSFVWYELLTSDPDAATRFYGAVIGWTAKDSGLPGMDYRLLNIAGADVGGLMALPAGAAGSGMRPGWLGYVNVADVDKTVGRFVTAGGTEHLPAMNVPGVGRMAMLADPQGAKLYVMTPTGDGASPSFAPGKTGHGAWHELHTHDWEAALAFYGAQFGWAKVRAMDMGPMGTYLQFNFGSGEMVGGMFNVAATAQPHWLYYFQVDDILAANRRVKANGGHVLVEPHQVPTGDWIIQASDPQGAMFALVGPQR